MNTLEENNLQAVKYDRTLPGEISVRCRYLDSDEYDKQDRWLRTFHYKDRMIAQITKIKHGTVDLFTLIPYFPCGNCITSVHPITTNLKSGEPLIKELIKMWKEFRDTCK